MNNPTAINPQTVDFPGNYRVHIALEVTDLEQSRRFYETLLGTTPTKQRPGYVKFEPRDPSINLTLNEVQDVQNGDSNTAHFGIQVKSPQEVQEAISRFRQTGLETLVEENTACCYAVQDKVWVTDPEGNRWEVFVVLEANIDQSRDAASACCSSPSAQESECC